MKRKIGFIIRTIGFILVVISIGGAINILDLNIAKILRTVGMLFLTIGVYLGCVNNKSEKNESIKKKNS